jgi:S-adenosylmethionine:tRNA ribosyltransferase-isomerase
MLSLRDFDFELPGELIAQYPEEKRGKARLLVLRRNPFEISHRIFENIVEYFSEGDVLVLNKTKVIKARLYCRRKTGGRVEILVTKVLDKFSFEGLVKPGRVREGEELHFEGGEKVIVREFLQGGKRIFELEEEVFGFLDRVGKMPLPPYIRRPPNKRDEEWYQTIFAEVPGSVAAPTAGLHFTEGILRELEDKGVKILYIVLHVGPGTFRPIKTEDITLHRMEEEYYEIPKNVISELNKIKNKGEIFSCGTTVTRALESWGVTGKDKGWTDLFIYPSFNFRVIDHLITNFHLPKSTPLLLTSAFAGKEKLFKAYNEAIEKRYRFFSYGDAMLIL